MRADAQTAVIAGLSLGGYMSLSFNVAFPLRALMLFDTGPGYRSTTILRRMEPHCVFACGN
jgi:esterase/lipase